MKRILTIFAAITFIASVVTNAQTNGERIAPTAPKVVKIDELSIKELLKPNGRPLLVNFWATWCVPCREEFPELVEINKKYEGRIDFITISLDDLAEIERDVPKFLQEMKATMPTYLLYTADENAVIGSISKDWEGGLPFSVLYSPAGDVVHTKQGIIKREVVEKKIDELFLSRETIVELPKSVDFYPNEKYNYQRGISDARRDVDSGRYIIHRYGFAPGISERSRNELKSKYNIEYREFGCMVTRNLIEYVKGYNKISKAEIKERFGLEF